MVGRHKNTLLKLLIAAQTLVACTASTPGDWQELREQANRLYNDQQFDQALTIYEQATHDADAEGQLKLRQDIIDCHLALGNDSKARALLSQLLSAAHDSGNPYAEAEASFALGEQLFRAGDRKAGYNYMYEAVRLMEQSDDKDALITLAYYHSRLMRFLTNEERYAAAIEASARLVQTARQIDDSASARAYLRQAYAIGAYLYMKADSLYPPQTRRQLADSAYTAWKQLLPCEKPNEEREIAPYYIASARYQEALHIYQRYEQQYVLDHQGYWSLQERVLKNGMAEVYAMMGQTDSAYSLLQEAYIINDTLHNRTAEQNAQELETVYQNQVKTAQISRLRLWVIVLGGLLAALTVALLIIRLRRLRERKNQAIINMAQQLPTPIEEECRKGGVETDTPDALRFVAFNHTVEQGRLYTQGDLTRQMLADLMGVDRTTFSRIIQEQSGCKNLKDYLNQKRMRLAEELLLQHPDHTIEAVAQDCGLGLTTLKRLFKEKHGMSPSDYRKSMRS